MVFVNRKHSIETREKMRLSALGKKRGHMPIEQRIKISKALSGTNNPNYGKKLSIEHKKKISQNHAKFIGEQNPSKRPEVRKKISENNPMKIKSNRDKVSIGLKLFYKTHTHPNKGRMGKKHTPTTRKKMSENHADISGDKNPRWSGGVSFEPYCPKFTRKLKEQIREQYNRTCIVCGNPENGEKLCVHHTDNDKMQGCEGKQFKLVPMCRSCHVKTHWDDKTDKRKV